MRSVNSISRHRFLRGQIWTLSGDQGKLCGFLPELSPFLAISRPIMALLWLSSCTFKSILHCFFDRGKKKFLIIVFRRNFVDEGCDNRKNIGETTVRSTVLLGTCGTDGRETDGAKAL